MIKAQCHCRECQYITGGAPNMFMVMPLDGFKYVKGTPKSFTRSDLEKPVTREFCPDCGTHLVTRPQRPVVVVKVGSLDDPRQYGGPQAAIYTIDKQPFHRFPTVWRPSSGCHSDSLAVEVTVRGASPPRRIAPENVWPAQPAKQKPPVLPGVVVRSDGRKG